MARVVNSRIRLLLLCILLVFAALLARAGWIATVRASSLSEMAQIQTKATVVLPAGRGTIFDSMGAPLALGEQATTVVRRPAPGAPPAHGGAGRRARPRPEGGRRSTRCSRTARTASSTSRARPTRTRGEAREAEARRASASTARSGARTRSAPSRRRCSATRASTTRVSRGSSSQLDGSLTRHARRAGRRPRPVRAPDQRSARTVPARPGKAVFLTLDQKIQANAEQVLRATPSRSGARRARPRSCSIRRRARCSRWRRRRRTTRTSSRALRRSSSATTR